MIESQQNREIVLRQLALAWDEGAEAIRDWLAYGGLDGECAKPINPYREEKDDEQ